MRRLRSTSAAAIATNMTGAGSLGVLFSGALLCASVASCSDADGFAVPKPTAAADPLPAGAHEGTLVRYVATFADGHAERRYSLREDGSTDTLWLTFDGAPPEKSGARMRVWGDADGTKLHVSRYDVVLPAERAQLRQELPPDTRLAPKVDTYAFVLVDVGQGVDLTAAAAQKLFFSTTPSDNSFYDLYNESSFGQYTISGDVVGPFKYPDTACNTCGMVNTIQPMITKKYNHYVYYIGPGDTNCSFGGLGEEGSAGSPATNTWLNAWSDCGVVAQEPGHNLGWNHSGTLTCQGASFSANASSCSIDEYGDQLSPMGNGCNQFNAYEKWYENWLSGCNAVKVQSSGTFNIVPYETQCPGAVQVLQIPMPTPQTVMDPQDGMESLKYYYVELRAPVGAFDSKLQPGVWIYVSDEAAMQWSSHTYILDMNPATKAFDPFSQGQTFTDPGGALTITVNSVSATGATIQVNVPGSSSAASTCLDGTHLMGSGPTACMASGSSSGGGSGSSSGSSSGSTSGSTSGSSSGGGSGGTSGSSSGDTGSSSGGSSGGGSGSGHDAGPSGSSGGSTSGSGSSSGGSGGSSGGLGGTSSSGGMPAPGSDGGDDGLNAFAQGQGAPGCACEAAGAGRDAPSGWLSLGVAAVFGWSARKRKRARVD